MDLTPTARQNRLARWGPPAALAVGLPVLAAVFFRPLSDRNPFELGLSYPVLRYEELLALVGLGFAMAQMRGRWLTLNAVLLAIAIPLGGVLASEISAALAAGLEVIDYVLLIAPAGCITAGLALVSPRILRVWLLPLASLVSGVALGLVLNFDNPVAAEWKFAGGTILCGVWLVATALLLWRRFEQPWFQIHARILGGWLVAIGAMLGALPLVPH